jgi:hypothetical protein
VTLIASLLDGLLGGNLGGSNLLFNNLLDGLGDFSHLGGLASNTLLLADGVLGTASLTLGIEFFVTDLLGLELVDGFHKDVLVLELVTLASEVELVVDVTVDFLGVSVAFKKATEDASAAHSEDAGGHTGVGCTTAVTSTLMATLALLSFMASHAGAGVHVSGLADNDTILIEFADILAYIKRL